MSIASTFSGAMMALAGPVAKKVLTSLGIGFISYVGVSTAVTSALSAAKAAFTGVAADLLQIIAMFGFFTAFSIIAGGITAGVAMMTMNRLGKLT